ncbi:variable large family protein, partial [Borreliella garinii]|uniref:variable large family protein n=2 Tax=Borreliella garinii TaxID=29519 RepID=UPI001AEEA895
IAAALVLRGVAKGGKFAAAAANDKEKVKAVVESAVVKTFGALTDLVRGAAEAGLKKVSKVIQDAGKKAPSDKPENAVASSTASN